MEENYPRQPLISQYKHVGVNWNEAKIFRPKKRKKEATSNKLNAQGFQLFWVKKDTSNNRFIITNDMINVLCSNCHKNK